MPNWVNFAEIRSRVSLEDVIVRYYKIDNLKRDGPKLIGPCPVHGGDSPRAFHADLEKNVWHCFSRCQKGGNQIDFVAAKDGIGIRDAALRLQGFFLGEAAANAATQRPQPPTATRAPAPAPSPAPTNNAPTKQPAKDEEDTNAPITVKLDLKSDHPHLIEERKLQLKTCEHFGVGYCGRGIMRGLIAIPVHDEDGDLVAYAGRRLKPSDIREFGKYKLPKGFKKERVIYNLHRALPKAGESGVIVVEGFFAVMKLFEAGLENVVATMGCEVSEYQVARLATVKEVIILFDGDGAGRAGASHLAEALSPKTCVRVVLLPEGMKPDQLTAKALRWIVNGMKALNLAVLSFAFLGDGSAASSDTNT